MSLSVNERQARRREKLKAKGKVFFQVWVTTAQAEQIKALLDGGQVTYHAPALAQPVTYHSPAQARRKRRRKINPVQERNREIFEGHQAKIRSRLAAGEKPNQIAAWLNTFGFIGTGGTVNGFLNAFGMRRG